ncbi:MAG: isocitrate/isopropylmalate dehydrogenase family protein [Calditrichaeota bacterium]|nr:MAG: isocitrate/isopropylmalate dehydrogenase family protein [Calditrichota bacterium]
MAKYKIAWLPGDGIGIEVLEATEIILDKLGFDAELIHGDIGWEFWCKEGDPLPQRTIDLLKNVDAAMFGAITSKPAKEAVNELDPALRDKGFSYRSPIVRMRQTFELYNCMRPTKGYPGNPLNHKEGIDIVVFRENTEDLYAGVEYAKVPLEVRQVLSSTAPAFARFKDVSDDDLAISCKINTRQGCEKIIRAAFDFAKKFNRKKVTVVHKANVVRATDGLFLETGKAIAKEYPGIELDDANIDAMCMWLLKNPHNYDVLVAPNLYGDIVSDLCAQMVGGLGFACSGNIGNDLAVFEPTHGSAPKYAGQYKVNPIATLLAAKMMLDWLGETEMGRKLEASVASVIKEGKVKTYDMGGSVKTLDMARAIAEKL